MLIKRENYLKKLKQLKDKNLITVITGIRRAGKSTLLEIFRDDLLQQWVPAENIIFINFEDRANIDLTNRTKLHDEITAKLSPTQMNYVFLDEVQMVKDFERMVDSLFIKKNVDLYITGSNAFLLSGNLATLLSGRYISINILPLSFAEYKEALPQKSADELFRQYFDNSSFPEAVELFKTAPDLVNNYLKDIYETVVKKDIFQRHDIRDENNFERVIKFMVNNISCFVSAKSIADALNEQHKANEQDINHNTIDRYLQHLTESYFLYKADRYDIKGKKILKTQNKYFVVDLWFRKLLVSSPKDSDLGHRLENIVYLELRRRNWGNIWIGKADENEVDFVVQNAMGDRQYYQVAYTTHHPETLQRELKPLQKIKDNYQKFIITTDLDTSSYDGIQKINIIDRLLSS